MNIKQRFQITKNWDRLSFWSLLLTFSSVALLIGEREKLWPCLYLALFGSVALFSSWRHSVNAKKIK